MGRSEGIGQIMGVVSEAETRHRAFPYTEGGTIRCPVSPLGQSAGHLFIHFRSATNDYDRAQAALDEFSDEACLCISSQSMVR